MGLAKVHLQLQGEPPDLKPDAKTILFRVFQEVVNNALKHARADTIDDKTGQDAHAQGFRAIGCPAGHCVTVHAADSGGRRRPRSTCV